jgi:XTP/dITP diphosphohydrolase
MRKLLVATHNQGKIREYRELLAGLPLEITWLDAQGITVDVEETGATFEENARLKAESYAAMTGLLTWADDSGLEVDALGGRPGVYSARFGGPGLTDRQRFERLLAELAALPEHPRTARFRCVVALAIPGQPTCFTSGAVEGLIAPAPRGQQGFGYDPVFFLPEHDLTMAELAPETKNCISHRGRAAAAAKDLLHLMLAQNRL